MTSTTSSKWGKQFLFLYGWFLKRGVGLSVMLAILGCFIMPVQVFSSYLQGVAEISYNQLLSEFSLLFSACLLFVLIFTCTSFSYLHKKRLADLFESFPISRAGKFLAAASANFTLVFLPFLFNILLTLPWLKPTWNSETLREQFTFNSQLPFSLPERASASGLLPQLLGIFSVVLLACVLFSALIAVCCGTAADTVINIVVLNLLFPALTILLDSAAPLLLTGYQFDLISNMFLMTGFSPFGAGLRLFFPPAHDQLFSFWGFLAWWAVFAALALGLALLLLRRRKSEYAESSFAFAAPSVIIRVLVSFATGLGLGQAFYYWFEIGLPGFLIGAFAGATVAFLLLEVLYSRGFHRLKKMLPCYGAGLLLLFVFIATLSTGLFGQFYSVPTADEIKSVSVQYNGNVTIPHTYYWTYAGADSDRPSPSGINYHYAELTEPGNIQTATSLHQATLDKSLEVQTKIVSSPDITFVYQLKNGGSITRSYFLNPDVYTGEPYDNPNVLPGDMITKDANLFSLLCQLLNAEEYKKGSDMLFQAPLEEFEVDSSFESRSGIYKSETDTTFFEVIPTELTVPLLEALRRDILETTTAEHEKGFAENGGDYPSYLGKRCLILNVSHVYEKSDPYSKSSIGDSYPVPAYYEHTWAFLKEHGLFTN